MTKEDFEKDYAERSGITQEEYRTYFETKPCDCGHCDGFRVTPRPFDIRKLKKKYVFPRPEVVWFAGEMEKTLQANDHKGGWHDCTLQYLYEKLDEEVGELSACNSDEEVIKEAADVANIAMMIADNARRRLEALRK